MQEVPGRKLNQKVRELARLSRLTRHLVQRDKHREIGMHHTRGLLQRKAPRYTVMSSIHIRPQSR